MANLFTKHPHEVGITYFQHLVEALYIFARLTYSGVVMFVHAFLPFLFTKTASKTIFYFHDRFTKRIAAKEALEKLQEEEALQAAVEE